MEKKGPQKDTSLQLGIWIMSSCTSCKQRSTPHFRDLFEQRFSWMGPPSRLVVMEIFFISLLWKRLIQSIPTRNTCPYCLVCSVGFCICHTDTHTQYSYYILHKCAFLVVFLNHFLNFLYLFLPFTHPSHFTCCTFICFVFVFIVLISSQVM